MDESASFSRVSKFSADDEGTLTPIRLTALTDEDELTDLTDEHFGILAEGDVRMFEYALSAGADEVDYSPFYDKADD